MRNLFFIGTGIFLFACGPDKPVGPAGDQANVSDACPAGNDLSKIPEHYLPIMNAYVSTNSLFELMVCTEDTNGDGSPDFMVVKSSNQPDHESSYYNAGDSLYEAYDYQTNEHKYGELHTDQESHPAGPNKIAEQYLVMRVPIDPVKAETPVATSYATIGLALNGVSFFNEAAAPGDEITDELFTFDQCSGHPQQQGVYHYHVDPVCLIRDLKGTVNEVTKTVEGTEYQWLEDTGENAELLLGMLMDGFPVYGPMGIGEKDCLGNAVSVNIDGFNGHQHCTQEFPQSVYHYHVKTAVLGGQENPVFWISNKYFYGEPGSVGSSE